MCWTNEADRQIAEQAGAEVVRTQWLDFSTVSQISCCVVRDGPDDSLEATTTKAVS
jgi:hypothetical protein